MNLKIKPKQLQWQYSVFNDVETNVGDNIIIPLK
jgi:hypothetical protein